MKKWKKTVGGTTDVLTDKPKSGTRIEPDKIADTAQFVEQWPNYKSTAEKEAARKALAGQYGPKNAKIKDGIYSLNLDNQNVTKNKDALAEAGFSFYSGTAVANSDKQKKTTSFENEVAGKIPSWVVKKVGRGETLTDSDYNRAYEEVSKSYVNDKDKQNKINSELVKKLINERLKK